MTVLVSVPLYIAGVEVVVRSFLTQNGGVIYTSLRDNTWVAPTYNLVFYLFTDLLPLTTLIIGMKVVVSQNQPRCPLISRNDEEKEED